MPLDRKKRYLQIALNNNLKEAIKIIFSLPKSERILIEAGTPLIKMFGAKAIRTIKSLRPKSYVVADTKCSDLSLRDVKMAKLSGAQAVTGLGVAPIETINRFIRECRFQQIDSMLDLMNVSEPFLVLKELETMPDAVIIHRGVDETTFSKNKEIPFYQINQIKDYFDVLVGVAGGDSFEEVQRAIFNGADIVVLWKTFYQSTAQTGKIAQEFLKEIK